MTKGAPKGPHRDRSSFERSENRSHDKDLSRPSDKLRLVSGLHALQEFSKVRPQEAKVIWLESNWQSNHQIRDLEKIFRASGAKIQEKSRAEMDKTHPTHQGILVFANTLPSFDLNSVAETETATLMMVDGLEDPHNLGAIVRTSWLTGVSGILSTSDRSVGLTPTVHKVACGGIEHVPFHFSPQPAQIFEDLKKQGFWIFGLSHRAKKSLFDLQLPEKVVWCIGAEDKGLRGGTEKSCDELVSIPQLDAASSYNASVAAGMVLSETLRQKHRKKSSS